MWILSLISLASAADVVITADLPQAPATVAHFEAMLDAPRSTIQDMADLFGVSGLAIEEDAFGGLEHVVEGDQHLYTYDLGGAAFHDLALLKSRRALVVRQAAEVSAEAEELLAQLNLLDAPYTELVPGPVGKVTLKLNGPNGQVRGPWVTHQKATFQQVIDGLPGFGGGAWVDVIFAQGGAVAAISHTVRELEQVGELPVIPAQEALRTWERRMDETGRWDLHRSMFNEIDRIEVSGVTLGYYVPAVDELTVSYEPVWQILGTVTGEDGLGKPAVQEMIWYEPASPGRELYGIDVTPLD